MFGPGTGELVAVRAPPDDWLIVDGCGVERTKYGPALLAHYRASPRLIALTHPHRDHAVGVADVVDAFTQGPASTWPRIGLLWPTPRDRVSLRDLQAYFAGGVVEDALSAIRDRWRRHPTSRWTLEVGSSIPLGDATIIVASPEREAKRAAWRAWQQDGSYDPNRIASVLDISWKDQHVILGSDLVDAAPDRAAGWSADAEPLRWLARPAAPLAVRHVSTRFDVVHAVRSRADGLDRAADVGRHGRPYTGYRLTCSSRRLCIAFASSPISGKSPTSMSRRISSSAPSSRRPGQRFIHSITSSNDFACTMK